MHFDIDHYWPLTQAVEAALLGCWFIVVSRTGQRGDWAPVVTMALLAGIIPEILPVPSAYLVTKIPGFMLLYGGAAVLARAAVRTRRLGWAGLLCLATAWSLLEEFVLCQTSIHRVYWSMTYGGHPFGVNAVYFLWAFGVEAVGGFLVAAQLTEILFPDRRNRSWLSRRAAWTGGLAWLIALPIVWYGCTHLLERAIYHHYTAPPVLLIVVPGALALTLVAGTLTRRSFARVCDVQRAAPSAWLVGVVAAVLATVWLSARVLCLGGGSEIVFGHSAFGLREIPTWAAYLAAAAVVAVAVTLLPRWSASPAWSDMHRLALCAGVLLAEMIQALNAIAIGPLLPGQTLVQTYAVQLEIDALVVTVLIAAGLRLRHAHTTAGTEDPARRDRAQRR